MNKFTLAVVFSVLLLSGCGGDSNEAIVESNPVQTFDGRWANGCAFDQVTGRSNFTSLTINGSSATFGAAFYNNDTCSGNTVSTLSVPLSITYPGEIALSDCFNGEKVNVSVNFPIQLNSISVTEAQFALLPADVRDDIEITEPYDLLCTNQEGTILYTGDEATGVGISDATRPTSADLSFGINKI